jgi:hypothetical protein
VRLLNFNCVFPSCSFKRSGIEEEEFLKHLNGEHRGDMLDISRKENLPIESVKMIAVSNSTVFMNSG